MSVVEAIGADEGPASRPARFFSGEKIPRKHQVEDWVRSRAV